jgi:hypothetical protein
MKYSFISLNSGPKVRVHVQYDSLHPLNASGIPIPTHIRPPALVINPAQPSHYFVAARFCKHLPRIHRYDAQLGELFFQNPKEIINRLGC